MTKNKKAVKKSTKTTKKLTKQHPKHFAKVYWPYIPIIAVVLFGLFFGNVRPSERLDNPATLAYSTEMSHGGLLSSTNSKRAQNGLGPLILNSQLNSSANSKASDMVSRDYWAHNTPDGQEPWVFFDAAGYNYQKAGENLAYGYSSSSATVVGWMNSPSHRANILDTSYTEVGFGFKNSPNFIGTGPETIVVAHYAKPPNAPAPPPPTPAASPPQPQSLNASGSKPTTVAQSSNPESESAPAPEPVKQPEPKQEPIGDDRYNQAINTENPNIDEAESINTTKLQILTDGRMPWVATAISVATFGLVSIWLIKHAVLVKRFALQGEHFVAHHPLLDVLVVIIAAIAVYLSQNSGVVL